MTKTEDLLLREFERVYRDKHGIPFDYFPTQAINAGICRTREEYYSALNVLLDTGAVVKVGKREREGYYTTNLYTIPYTNLPEHRVTVQEQPTFPRTVTTLITPYDLRHYLDTKTTVVNDQVVPFSTLFDVEDSDIAKVQEFFNTNPVEVPDTCFQDFKNLNQSVIDRAVRECGVRVVNAYLGLWWKFGLFQPSPEVAPAPSLEICP